MINKKNKKTDTIVDDNIVIGNTIKFKQDFLSIHIISEQEYRRLKNRLQDIEKIQKSKFIYPIIIFGFTVFGIILYLMETMHRSIRIHEIIISALSGLCLGCIVSLYFYLIFELKENSLRRKINDYEVYNIQEEVKEDVFENSIKMSYKYLDQYYLQTREQAQRGFFVTICIVIGGAILIGIGITAMFLDKTTPSVITSASGIIIEFIAAVFFYLYNKTVSSMSSYHNKLVLSQNISLALKVADSLSEEEQAKSKALIISELIKNINSHITEEEKRIKNNKGG